MYLPLAERMTKKYVDEDKIDAEAGERHVRLVNHFVCVCVEIVTLCSCSLAYVCVCVCVCVHAHMHAFVIVIQTIQVVRVCCGG